MRRGLFLVAVAAALVIAGPHIDARQECKPIVGRFEASVVPPPDCTATLPLVCTGGRVWGGLQGEYFFTMSSAAAADPTVPFINFFTGQSLITIDGSGTLQALDTGTIDFVGGGFASLITVTGGSGAYAGATGQLRVTGVFDPAAGTTAGQYRGTVCRP